MSNHTPPKDGRSGWTAGQWRVEAAKVLGWEFSPAYNGYIHDDYHPNGPRNQYDSRPSEMAAEDACFIEGVETLGDAVKLVVDAEHDGHAGDDEYFAVMRKFLGQPS